MKPAIKEIEQKIRPVLQNYGIRSASIVGSVARGEQKAGSDIDIIVELNIPIGLFTFARIKRELESVLSMKVDLMELSALKPRIKRYLLQDEIKLSI